MEKKLTKEEYKALKKAEAAKTIQRCSSLSLNFANTGKLKRVKDALYEMRRVARLYSNYMWTQPIEYFQQVKQNAAGEWVTINRNYPPPRKELNKEAGIETTLNESLQTRISSDVFKNVKKLKWEQLSAFKEAKLKGTKPKRIHRPKIVNLCFILHECCVGKKGAQLVDIEGKDFDLRVDLMLLGKERISIPTKRHYHFNQFYKNDGWELCANHRLRMNEDGKVFLDVCFSKDTPAKKEVKTVLGLDAGVKSMLFSSDGVEYNTGMEEVYRKIKRKEDMASKQIAKIANKANADHLAANSKNRERRSCRYMKSLRKSKALKRALIERDNLINYNINKIDLNNIDLIAIENLNVKSPTRKKKEKEKRSKDYKATGKAPRNSAKLRKASNRVQAHWSYTECFSKLQCNCEIAGVTLLEVNPAYTSQTCSVCGDRRPANRNKKVFHCQNCGHEMDADHNAAINIRDRALLYFPEALKLVQSQETELK